MLFRALRSLFPVLEPSLLKEQVGRALVRNFVLFSLNSHSSMCTFQGFGHAAPEYPRACCFGLASLLQHFPCWMACLVLRIPLLLLWHNFWFKKKKVCFYFQVLIYPQVLVQAHLWEWKHQITENRPTPSLWYVFEKCLQHEIFSFKIFSSFQLPYGCSMETLVSYVDVSSVSCWEAISNSAAGTNDTWCAGRRY